MRKGALNGALACIATFATTECAPAQSPMHVSDLATFDYTTEFKKIVLIDSDGFTTRETYVSSLSVV